MALPREIVESALSLYNIITEGTPCYCTVCGAEIMWDRTLPLAKQLTLVFAAGVRPVKTDATAEYPSGQVCAVMSFRCPLCSGAAHD